MSSRVVAIEGRAGFSMRLFSGHSFWPIDPRSEEVYSVDIAHGLATGSRYSGQFPNPYNIAQHSILASYMVPLEFAPHALLHDSPEAYTGDLIKPLKAYPPLRDVWKPIETRIHNTICDRYGLQHGIPACVDEAGALLFECEMKAWNHVESIGSTASCIRLPPSIGCVADIGCAHRVWGWHESERMFLLRMRELGLT